MADDQLAKMYRKTKGKGELSKHWKQQFDLMRQLRECGVTGRITTGGLVMISGWVDKTYWFGDEDGKIIFAVIIEHPRTEGLPRRLAYAGLGN